MMLHMLGVRHRLNIADYNLAAISLGHFMACILKATRFCVSGAMLPVLLLPRPYGPPVSLILFLSSVSPVYLSGLATSRPIAAEVPADINVAAPASAKATVP